MADAASARARSLSASESETLDAVLARLIPSDEHGPGAHEARVLDFLEGVLASWDDTARSAFRENVAMLDRLAALECGARFAELDDAQQDALLARLEAGSADGFRPSASAFFELVRQHAVEGMFADPSHGGNAGFAGWRLLGFPGPKGVFEAADQAIDVDVPPAWADGD